MKENKNILEVVKSEIAFYDDLSPEDPKFIAMKEKTIHEALV